MTIKHFVISCVFLSLPLSAADLTEAEKLLATPLGQSALNDSSYDSASKLEAPMPSLGCLLHPSLDVDVASPLPGVIAKRPASRGDYVEKGDVLVQLRAEVERATLALNQAQSAYGKRTIKRNTELYKKNLISEQEKDEIIINNRLFDFEMAQTNALLRQKTIRSDFAGVVVETYLDPGEYVGEQPVLKLVQLNPLFVEVVVPARYYGVIKKGHGATVKLGAPWSSEHDATVDIVDKVLDAASGTFGVRLKLPNPKNHLPAGLKCDIRF